MREKLHVDSPSHILNSIKILGFLILFLFGTMSLVIAQNDNAHENATVFGGEITFLDGETYNSICIDGEADYIGVDLKNASGRVKQWIITDEEGYIVGLPDSPSDVNFDEEGVGKCLIYHLSYNGIRPLVDPSGQGKFTLHIDEIKEKGNGKGRSHLSNPIELERFLQPVGGTLEGGPFEFCVGDGEADHISDGAITLSGNMGTNSAWVVTDADGNILGLPDNYTDVDFDEVPAGTCLIWHLSYEKNVSFDIGTNVHELTGCKALTNPITVNRFQQPSGGTLEGGPFEFCVGDGVADHISEGAITLSGNMGTNSAWVVTDADGNILGLPDNYTDVDFDEAPAGTCLIWHLSYEDNVSFDGVTNADQLTGCYALTNPITVNRFQQPSGGTLEGGPFEFCVGDGEVDHIAEGAITLSGNMGTNSAWVVTDSDGNILGLPANYMDVNFDEAPAGICLIWYLSYEDNVSFDGVTNADELTGCFALTNPITVNRIEINGGTIAGGTDGSFSFTVGDGTADKIAADAITLTDNVGANSQWVVTNEDGSVILGLPANYADVDFDGSGAGTCKIWHLSYEDGLEGLTAPDEGDHLVSGLSGACFDLSNSLSVVRTASSSRISIFPNPTKSSVNIDYSGFKADNVNISIFNLRSVQLSNKDYTSSSKRTILDVSDYDAGLYFMRVTNNETGDSEIKRFIVN